MINTNFYDAWHWLYNHPINLRPYDHDPSKSDNIGLYELDIWVAKVNPNTNRVEDNASLNTQVEIWLELGPFTNYAEGFPEYPTNYQRSHDPRLDCGGKTFEEAIIKLATLVKKHWGDYRENNSLGSP